MSTAVDRPRFGNEIFGTFGRDFRTKDGKYVMICIFSDRHLEALAKAGGFADAFARIEKEKGVDLKLEADRWNARAELVAVIEPWVAGRSAADVAAALQKAGALWAPYQTFRELSADKDAVLDNPMFTVLDQPGIGRYPVAASPVQFDAVPREKPVPAPTLGQHTDEILSGILGLSSAEIAQTARREGRWRSPVGSLSPAAASAGSRRRWRWRRRASPRWSWRRPRNWARSAPASSSDPMPSTASIGWASARRRAAWRSTSISCA